ncbi:MAG: NAD-dependent epimerase/dehydratase family protein [Verrucomicrobiaceae bacterium]
MNLWGQNTALIGYTGFVGSNLTMQGNYSALFNSGNIPDISEKNFDTIVCAGVQAVKWKANKEPETDWAGIEKLLQPLATVKAARFILLSTIDVYASPNGVTEYVLPTMENHAYGRHRLKVEEFVRDRFANHHIIRLPGLFGPGLKKNVIFDLLHDNCLDAIQPLSSFQYYHLKHLSADLEKMVRENIRVLNLATEPVSTKAILDSFAPEKVVGSNAGAPAHYDFRSNYDALWNCRDGYLYDAPTVLREIGEFMRAESERLNKIS